MKAIGRVKIKYQQEVVDATLYDNGSVELPDGKNVKLKKEQFEALKEQLTETQPQFPQGNTSMMTNGGSVFNGKDLKSINEFQTYDDTAERKYRRKKRVKVFIAILALIAVCFAAYYLVRMRYPEVLGLAPNSYKVTVANTDIAAGATITEDQLSYIELSRDEYTAQCTNMYMAEDGSMKTDTPIFFVNATNQIVGKFAAEDITAGSMIRLSSVTNQIYSGSVTVNGEQQTVDMTESQLNGQTSVEIIARITSSDGTIQEVPISSMKLQGKTLTELLDGNGQSILNQSESTQSETEGDQESNIGAESQQAEITQQGG